MVFDTLFGVDEQGAAQPQMLDGYTTEPDGLTWTLSVAVRPDCSTTAPPCSPGTAWPASSAGGCSDAFGQALAAATNDLSAPDDRTIRFRLKRAVPICCRTRWPIPTNTMAAMMPERLANTPATCADHRDGG